jgi:superfamily I DNA/RNA helicase
MDYANFVSKGKSFVVAPAGYGKTHAIAICLKHTKGKQLVLTHTHAGVASLKDKIQSQGISNNLYRVETITSFAQKYVNAFYCGDDIPEQDNSNEYYPFIIEKAKILHGIAPIKDVIKCTYAGLFVDEYQDCNLGQHNLIEELASILRTRVLGDHLQGIFDFNGDTLVNFDEHLTDFEKFPDLNEPWRWKNKNPDLGESLKEIREMLEQKQNINLDLHNGKIEILQTEETEKYDPRSEYNRKIWDLCNEDNVLIIHPNSANLNIRKEFTSRFNNAFILVEAIDSKDFYVISHKLDSISCDNAYSILFDLIPTLFNGTTSRNKWFSSTGIKNKRSNIDKNHSHTIGKYIDQVKQKLSMSVVSKIFKKIEELPDMKCYRKELLWDLCDALELADLKTISVYEAMKEIRNRKRRGGRNLVGRCIGTTLLVKGLEFDTVAILDAHNFNCPKNFYVAITRACRKLIIFTNSKVLSPYAIGH